MYSTESIPKAIVSVHISVVYLPVIRAVINRCLILIELIEFTWKQERTVQAGIKRFLLFLRTSFHFDTSHLFIPYFLCSC